MTLRTSDRSRQRPWRFRKLCGWCRAAAASSPRRKTLLRVEVLEDRCVPSISPGNVFPIGISSNDANVAVAPDGHFVVLTPASVGPVLQAQLFNADGTARSAPVVVSTAGGSSPRAAFDGQGDFVVTWANGGGAWYLTNGATYARRFNAAGQPLGDAFQVSQTPTYGYNVPSVAMDAGGDFVIAWENRTNFGNYYDIYARRYNAAGVAQGGEFQVDPATNGSNQRYPQVALDAAGDFVIAWESDAPGAQGPGGIYVRPYSASGQPLAGALAVSQSTDPVQSVGGVAMDAAGDFVVAWADGLTVEARRYAAGGVAQGNAFQVNPTGPPTSSIIQVPAVAMDALGDFVVTWGFAIVHPDPPPGAGTYVPLPGTDPGPLVYARLYSAAGRDVSGPMQVNQGPASASVSPDPVVAMDAGGDFTVAWDFPGQSSMGLDARRYTQAPAGYAYDPATQTLTITAAGGRSYFAFSQATTLGGMWSDYTFNINGILQTYNRTALSHVVVRYPGSGNTAVLYTNDTYLGSDGTTHETTESVALGQSGGRLYRTGDAAPFLRLSGFATAYGFLGHADAGALLATAGPANELVTTPTYSYLVAPGTIYYISGAGSVYGYAANAIDMAYHYDGSGASTYIASGTAFSAMMGKDNGISFYNEAVGFTRNYGIARHPGQDTAYFYDSPGNDVFVGNSGSSYLYRDNPDGTFAEFDYAQGFAQVYAVSSAGGSDVAYVYDTAVNHVRGFRRLA
jgi:hypothetical protein